MIKKNLMYNQIQLFKGVPLPSVIEISNSGTCNRSCSFCPRSSKDYPDVKKFISQSLIDKLSEDLSTLSYKGVVSFCGLVEPLLSKSIYKNIEVIRKRNPDCVIEIVTNGDPITVVNLNKLFKAGLNYLIVSCYDGPHQIEEITNMVRSSDMPIDNVIFRNRWLGPEDNFNISLSNRGGLMKSAEYSIEDLEQPLLNKCNIPSYKLFLDYTGQVLLCDHDWGKKAVMGNLKNQSIFEIWTGKRFTEYRNNLLNGNRNQSPCSVCNVKGDRIGNNYAIAWKEKG